MENELDTLVREAEGTATEQARGAEQAGPTTGDLLFPLVDALFQILAPNWSVTQAESRQLADAYGIVLDKHFPDLAMGPEMTAIVLTVAVVAPRLGTPRKAKADTAPGGKPDDIQGEVIPTPGPSADPDAVKGA